MINRVVLRRFKRFDEVEFRLPDHIVLAGPNNMGKTTLLQAIAAWDLALKRWKELNDYNVRQAYTYAPIARQAFSSVPLRTFELLWNDRRTGHPIEVEVHFGTGSSIRMEFQFDSTEQVKVRPHFQVHARTLKYANLRTTYIPAMSGLSREEPQYARPETIDELLAQGRPGEVLRNLLYIANQNEAGWRALTQSIRKLFNVALLPPQIGAYITSEYTEAGSDRRLDIASAGSGFQQVLMLLALLHTRDGTVLLLDEPDAHLHVILQDAIYAELRRVAAERRSQLIIATHSEVLIESVDPRELMLMYGRPHPLADNEEKRQLIRSLGALSHSDIMLAENVRGVLYVEDYTDLELLRMFARVLGLERIEQLLTKEIVWKWSRAPLPEGVGQLSSREHWRLLRMIRAGLPAVELLDGDSRQGAPRSEPGFTQLRWHRYEIESYLFHPTVLRRFVAERAPGGERSQNVRDLDAYLARNLPPAFLEDPLADSPLLTGTKARTDLLPPALEAAGIRGLPYTRYHEIAAAMQPDDVHPEIRQKLEAIGTAFDVRP